MNKNILRGDLYYADLEPVIGSEQGGIRPVLIIQNNIGNRYSSTVIVAAITGKEMKTTLPTHCVLLEMQSGLDRESIILLEQIRTIDKQRLRDYVGALTSPIMREVDKALSVSVGLRHKKTGGN